MRLLKLKEVVAATGLSRSSIYALIAELAGVERHEARLRVHGLDGSQVRRGAAGLVGVDDSRPRGCRRNAGAGQLRSSCAAHLFSRAPCSTAESTRGPVRPRRRTGGTMRDSPSNPEMSLKRGT